jgi:hypothetical protein
VQRRAEGGGRTLDALEGEHAREPGDDEHEKQRVHDGRRDADAHCTPPSGANRLPGDDGVHGARRSGEAGAERRPLEGGGHG